MHNDDDNASDIDQPISYRLTALALVELGRALMSEARVILLDEPAAGVNRTLLREIAATIAALPKEQRRIPLAEAGLIVLHPALYAPAAAPHGAVHHGS